MHHHLPSRLARLKQRPFPTGGFCCPARQRYYGLLRLLARLRTGLRAYHAYTGAYPRPQPGSHEISLVALFTFTTFRFPYAGGFLRAVILILHPVRGLRQPSSGSAPSFPRKGLVTTLQNSLYVTDCRFAHPSRVDISLRHRQSPDGTGNLLPGSQAITGTGLTPASKQHLARHTRGAKSAEGKRK